MSYRFIGQEYFDNVGTSVSLAGDVDGDGLDDLLIGAAGASDVEYSSGEVYLIMASALEAADLADGSLDGAIHLGLISDTAGAYRLVGTSYVGYAGIAVTLAGDVDNDGLDDLFIASHGADGNDEYSSRGEIHLLNATALDAADLADGVADGVIDLGNVNEQADSYQFNGIGVNDYAGFAISSAGDIDGDGQSDLLIGAEFAGGGIYGTGEVYLINADALEAADLADGQADGMIDLDNVNEQAGSYQIIGADGYDLAGRSLSSAGDVDGDGLADFLIGAILADGGGDQSGEVYLLNATTLEAADLADGLADGVIDLEYVNEQTGSYRFIGAAERDWAGASVSLGGDFDGDGQSDLLIGAEGADDGGEDSGVVYLLNADALEAADLADGLADGVIDLEYVSAQVNSYKFVGTEEGDEAGYSISSAGDVDGDGLSDILIGAEYADGGGPSSGEAYLLTAQSLQAADLADGLADGVIDLDNVNEQAGSYQFIGKTGWNHAGYSVSLTGDVDGDGKTDLMIGAPKANADSVFQDAGEAYLLEADKLALYDARDGAIDGVIDLAAITSSPEPQISVPAGRLETVEEVPIIFSAATETAILVIDDDPEVTVSLSTVNGMLALTSTADLAVIDGDGTDGTLSVRGSEVALNTAFAAGLTYTAYDEYSGSDELIITADDGTHVTADSIQIWVGRKNDAPIAQDDQFLTDEVTVISGDVLADNGAGPDLDAEGHPLTVVLVDGQAGVVGTSIILASGALLTLNADGSFEYDPNGAFDHLVLGENDTDSFTYQVTDERWTASATVTVTIEGASNDDLVVGTRADDLLAGRAGDDTVFGLIGDDEIYGGDGKDALRGQQGDDTLFGGKDNDILIAGQGNDLLNGGQGADHLSGGNGNDTVFGNAGDDVLIGGRDDDALFGGFGDDRLNGQLGNDLLIGDAGDDLLIGGGGDDDLFGGEDADVLYGNGGSNALDGGSGQDVLIGGDAVSVFTGGLDSDVFVIRQSLAGSQDIITDFDVLDSDEKIDLSAFAWIFDEAGLFADRIKQIGSDVLIETDLDGVGRTILIEGVLLSDLDSGDFIF